MWHQHYHTGTRNPLHIGKVKQRWITKRRRGSWISNSQALKNQQGIKGDPTTQAKTMRTIHDLIITITQLMAP